MTSEWEREGASTVDADDPSASAQPRRGAAAARYTVEDELSRGGLGRVMRGRDHNLERTVAIKQLIQHSPRFEARFRREAKITARLQHPGIVPIYETGELPTGEPFYAMKLVSGTTLEQELAAATTLDARLGLVPKLIAMCDAIAYAHSERVIHRDLKPANVMVGPFGEVLVVDWGLAKDLDGEPEPRELANGTTELGLTRDGAVMGTVPYLAPEQARGEPVDERADVYALGAILYHALAGALPYAEGDSAELLAQVRDRDPVALTAREPGIPRELAAIVAQAMARDPARRYANAGALVADLRRFQTGQLVAAHRYSRGMLLRRWLRRHRVVLVASAIAAVAIAVVATVSIREVLDERDLARVAQHDAETATHRAETESAERGKRTSELLLAQARHWLDVDATAALGWIKQYAASAAPSAAEVRSLAVDALARGAAHDVLRGMRATELAQDGTVLCVTHDQAIGIWRRGHPVELLTKALPDLQAISIRRDGRYVAWVGRDVMVHDLTTGRTWKLAAARQVPNAREMAFVGDVVAVGRDDGEVDVIALADGTLRPFLGHTARVKSFAVSDDDRLLASTAGDQTVRIWTVATGAVRSVPAASLVDIMAFSHGGARFAFGGRRTQLQWLDLASPGVHVVARPKELDGAFALAFSPDGRSLASGGLDSRIYLDDLETGRTRALPDVHNGVINNMAYDATGKLLVTAQGGGGPAIVWDLATGEHTMLLGHDETLSLVGFAADHELVTGDLKGQIRRWTVAPARERVLQHVRGPYISLLAVPAGLIELQDGHPEIWTALDAPPRVPVGPDRLTTDPVASADGSKVAFGDAAGRVWLWAPPDGTPVQVDTAATSTLAISRDGRYLAVGGSDGALRLLDLGPQPTTRELTHRITEIRNLVFAPDGKHFAMVDGDQQLMIWDVASGAGKTVANGTDPANDLVYLPDGRLAVGRTSGTLDLISPDGSRRALRASKAQITTLAVIDGDTLATGADDGTIRIWTLSTGTSTALHQPDGVSSLVALPGRRLASGNTVDKTAPSAIRIWDVSTGLLVDELRGSAGTVRLLAPLADGTHLASICVDGATRVWPLPPPGAIPRPDAAWLATLTSAVLDDHDVIASP